MTIGTKEMHNKELKAAKNAVLRHGIKIEAMPRPMLAIKIVKGNDFTVVTPMFFEVGEDRLIDTYHKFKSLGFCGSRILKALVHAFYDLTITEIDDIRYCCWVKNYNAVDMIQFFYNWCINQIEVQKIKIGSIFTKKAARNLWYSFGGYRGLKAFFVDGLEATLTEFKRIRQVEENLEMAKEIVVNNPDIPDSINSRSIILDSISEKRIKPVTDYVGYHPCMTCSRCKVDRYGLRTCKLCYINIPEDMTVKTVNMIYPEAHINDCGKLKSAFIMHNPGECKYQQERIGCKIKKTSSNPIMMITNN